MPLRDLRVERHLGDRRAVVALEDVDLPSGEAQRLALSAPRCRVILTSSERVLYDGTPWALEGFADEHVATIAEQELGRALSGRERAAAAAVGAALGGHPLRLRQTFSRAREQGLSIDALAPRAADAHDEAAQLSEPERAVARTLAVHGRASLGVEHTRRWPGLGRTALPAHSKRATSRARTRRATASSARCATGSWTPSSRPSSTARWSTSRRGRSSTPARAAANASSTRPTRSARCWRARTASSAMRR